MTFSFQMVVLQTCEYMLVLEMGMATLKWNIINKGMQKYTFTLPRSNSRLVYLQSITP